MNQLYFILNIYFLKLFLSLKKQIMKRIRVCWHLHSFRFIQLYQLNYDSLRLESRSKGYFLSCKPRNSYELKRKNSESGSWQCIWKYCLEIRNQCYLSLASLMIFEFVIFHELNATNHEMLFWTILSSEILSAVVKPQDHSDLWLSLFL